MDKTDRERQKQHKQNKAEILLNINFINSQQKSLFIMVY